MTISAKEFARQGFCVEQNYLSVRECEQLLSSIEDYRRKHEVPRIYRENTERSLNYAVIDGLKIERHFPEIRRLYSEVNKIANRITGLNLAPMQNPQVGANVNITLSGGSYRWHYDRNKITGILYLNEIEGGETEFYPNYRLYFGKRRYSNLQKWADNFLRAKVVRGLFGKQILLKPSPGSLLLMRGDKCLHSVRPVLGGKDRINLVFSYDLPDVDFAIGQNLDDYLYTQNASNTSDPNYKT